MLHIDYLAIDIAIVLLFLGFILWQGMAGSRGYSSTEDFFLAGRSLGWPMIGFSLFVTNISSSSLIGLTSSGYKHGIAVFNYEWTGSVILAFFAVFIAPYYLQQRLYTVPEFLERRYDVRIRYYFSGLSILTNIFIDAASALYVGGILFKQIFPSLNLSIFILFFTVLAGIYTTAGGLKAVVRTDFLQSVMLILGAVLVSFFVVREIESWNQVSALWQSQKMDLFLPQNDEFLPWPGILISLPILGFYFMCINQYIVQRVLGSRTLEEGRKGAIFAGFLKLMLLFIVILPGTLANVIFPGIEASDQIYPKMIFELIPTGLLGIVLAGFIAALMSTIDSALSATASMATMDFYRSARKESSDQELVRMGKFFTLVFVVLASVWAPFISQFPTLWDYLQSALAYLIPPLVSCFLIGLLWKRATSSAALISLLIGNGLSVLFMLNNVLNLFGSIHYLYVATLNFSISAAILILLSVITTRTSGPAEKQNQSTHTSYKNQIFRSKINFDLRKPLGGWSDFRLMIAFLFSLITILLIVFQ